jgi:hypothetical protein
MNINLNNISTYNYLNVINEMLKLIDENKIKKRLNNVN